MKQMLIGAGIGFVISAIAVQGVVYALALNGPTAYLTGLVFGGVGAYWLLLQGITQ